MPDYHQIIQEIKKLDRDSLLRLSGFLDGLLSDSLAPATSLSPTTQLSTSNNEPKNVLIAFASQSGNAENVALELAEALQQKEHVKVSLNDVAEINIKKLNQYAYIFIIASTHGEGEPPDTAIQFYEQLKSNRAPKLTDVEYSVMSLGDSSYEQFCSFGIWIDERLSELGAKTLVKRMDCDVDYENVVPEWKKNILDALNKLDIEGNTANNSISAQQTRVVKNNYNIKNPLQVEVISNVDLCTEEANKHVHHLELELPSNQINYLPGDSLGISISNPRSMIDEIINISGFTLNEQVNFNNKTCSLEECLNDEAELFRITNKQLETLINHYPNETLQKIVDDSEDISEFIFSQDWLSLLKHYTQCPFPNAQSLVDSFNPQGQRLYSISSSPTAHEDEVHLSIRLREFGDEKRLGLISDKVSQLTEGDNVNVYLKANKNFRLPEDESIPIIMIGSGTGIAPFRAFLYHRLELGITSPSWLFFGEQSFRNSFLYQTDWLKLREKKALSQLTVAFSREGKEKHYVQDKLREHAKEVYKWIEQGAVIYVCGSADGMAPAVHNTLIDIIAGQSGVNQEAAGQRLQQLMIEGLYKRDVY